MNPLQQNHLDLTRREFFGKSATGVGTIALSNLLNDAGLAADNDCLLYTSDAADE